MTSEESREEDSRAQDADDMVDVRADDEGDGPLTDREHDVADILAEANRRDVLADERDTAADQRDMAANLDAFVHNVDDGDAFQVRQLASQDRRHSRGDRIASEEDRSDLASGGRDDND